MKAEELIQAGKLPEALAALQDSVRNNPADPVPRIALFQLQCVLGNWEKAVTQLNVLAGINNPDCFLLAKVFEPAIQCELLRKEVFAGRRTPMLFGEPAEWMGLLVQAAQHVAKGEYKSAQTLREQAFEQAPATRGKINDQPFEWIADADTRLGPMLEVIFEGRYYWVPFSRLQRVTLDKPTELRDLVWCSARFTWSNGGETSGFVPTRYVATELTGNDTLRLSRTTEWQSQPGDTYVGYGQRILTTDQAETPLLDIRTIELEVVP